MKTSEHPCPICGQQSATRTMAFELADVYRCQNCRHSFSANVKPRPDEIYDQDYFARTHKNYFENPDLELFGAIRDRVQDRFGKGARVVDVGCGTGNLLRFLAKEGFTHLTGIDLVPGDGGQDYRHVQADFMTAPLEERFDVAVSVMNIEHIDAPGPYVSRLHGLLEPEGLLIVNTINEDSLVYGMSRVLYRLGIHFAAERLYDPHHTVHYSGHSLKELCEANSFRLLDSFSRDRSVKAMDFPAGAGMAVVRAGVFSLSVLANLIGKGFSQTQVFVRE